MTRDEALRLQDEVVQDAIIQIDSRFAGVALQTDIDELKDKLRAQFREKMESLRDLVFDALEGKIDEIRSMMDVERYDGRGK